MRHRPDTPEAAYAGVATQLARIATSFRRRYGEGDDPEEILAQAQLHFMEAYHSYDPSRGTQFSTWVHYHVWRQLLRAKQKAASRNAKLIRTTLDPALLTDRRRFHLRSFLEGLPPRARDAVRLALEEPEVEPLRKRAGWMRRNALIDTLLDLGWAGQQIAEAFREIRTALYDP